MVTTTKRADWNKPCRCGSGKEYVDCHRLADRIEELKKIDLTRKATEIDERLVSEMMEFAARRFGMAWSLRGRYEEESPAGDSNFSRLFSEQFLHPQAVYDSPVDGRPVAAWYLEECGPDLPEIEQKWLLAQREAWLSIWTVTQVVRSTGLGFTDALTGRERFVYDSAAPFIWETGKTILARMVDFDGVSAISSLHLYSQKARYVQIAIERLCTKSNSAPKQVPVEVLRKEGSSAVLLAAWERTFHDLKASAAASSM